MRWPFRHRVLRVAIVERGKPVQRMTVDARGARTRLRAGGATVIVREGRAAPPPERKWMRRARPVSWRTMDKTFALSLIVCSVLGFGSAVALERMPPPVPPPVPLSTVSRIDRIIIPDSMALPADTLLPLPDDGAAKPPSHLGDPRFAGARRRIRECFPGPALARWSDVIAVEFHVFRPEPDRVYLHTTRRFVIGGSGGADPEDTRVLRCVRAAAKRLVAALPFDAHHYGELRILFAPPYRTGKRFLVTWQPGPRPRRAPPRMRL